MRQSCRCLFANYSIATVNALSRDSSPAAILSAFILCRGATMKHLLALICLITLSAVAIAGEKQDERARNAVAVLDKVMLVPEQSIPESMLRDAQAVAVIPGVVKAGLGVGGRFGRGLHRSEERRVGKECVGTVMTWWAPDH